MKPILKKANKKDFSIIAEIYAKEFSKPPYNEPWTKKKAIEKINLFSKYCDLWKIIYNNKIVGFIAVNPHWFFPGKYAFGEDLAIKKEFQGKGIGTFVINEIFKIYKQKGFEYFMEVANTKSRAIKLYKKLNILPSKDNLFIEKRLN
ncbi:MAG: GNAT family N-acetyltransferase [Nanoarchaeota archaeon]